MGFAVFSRRSRAKSGHRVRTCSSSEWRVALYISTEGGDTIRVMTSCNLSGTSEDFLKPPMPSNATRRDPVQDRIRGRLVERAKISFCAPAEFETFTGHPEADRLVNDLSGHPHAFLLGCVMDRQIAFEKAWLIPYRISEKLNGFSIEVLARLSAAEWRA
jgi:hypothetical protein